MPLHVSSTVVLIIRRSKLYYTAPGIITPAGGRPVRRLRGSSLCTVHTATGIYQADSSICLTYVCCCMYSLELLMMDGKTVRNM